MKNDINDRNDIIFLVDTFYKSVALNSKIGPIFIDIAKIDWAHHLPKMYDFWREYPFWQCHLQRQPHAYPFCLK